MRREDLADEIRGAGNALRYADGPVLISHFIGDRSKSLHSPVNKLKMPDSEIISRAATCSTCDIVASQADIELAEEWADCYQSFARLIWPCIEHEPNCPAQPYISVSKSASKRFQKIKAKFEEKRQAWAEAKAKMTPEERKVHLRKRREARLKREAEDWAVHFARLDAAMKKEEKQGRTKARKPAAKKSKPTKKAKKKPAPKKPTKKKSTKRKSR